MGLDATARRRWIGGLLLVAALGMLISGQTFLKNYLKNLGFLLYWLLCLVLTATAIIVAYLDARAVQNRTRKEARELLQNTLTKIEQDAKQRPHRDTRGNGN